MDAVEGIKFVLENYKELGSSASAAVMFVFFAYYKFIQKQFNAVKTEIKADQKLDKEKFEELKSVLDGLLAGASELERIKNDHAKSIDHIKKNFSDMNFSLEAQERKVVENAHRIELNQVTINTLKGIITDLITDTKKFGERANSMEMSLAKMLGALSKNFD